MGFIVRNRFRRSALCIIRSRSSKSPPLHDSHNFKYRNAASSDQTSAAKGPRKLSSRTKYKSQESLPGKKKRFPPINFRRSCESFSTPSRHIISPNHRSSPIASPSFSLVRPQSWLPPSSGEFVITRREPRNRNFAGYDDIYIYIQRCSKETRRKGKLYPLRRNGERWVESNLQTSCTHPSQECPERRLGEETVWRFPLTA